MPSIMRSWALGAALAVLAFAKACDAKPAKPACPLHGLAFSPYVRGQDPADRVVTPEKQIRSRLALLEGRTRWIRSYGSAHGLERIGRLAHEAGFETAIGAWLDRDLASNEVEIENLVAAANAGDVDVAIVGNEVLLRGDLTPGQLVAYLARVRSSVPAGVRVTTAEPHHVWNAHPEVVDAVDVVFAHIYPFFDGVPIDHAIPALHRAWQGLRARVAPKTIVVAETGWPSAGEAVGDAQPSKQNADSYLLGFVAWAEANSVPYLYFEAFDEAWKTRSEGKRGAHWGVASEDGRPKEGLKQALLCEPPGGRVPGSRR